MWSYISVPTNPTYRSIVMKYDPKKDASFQNALQEILKGVVPLTPITLEVPKLDLPHVQLLPVEVSQKKGTWVSAEDFFLLRVQWFWAHCFPEDHEKGAAEAARQAYTAVRDTPEAQRFLEKNEASFTKLHHSLCKAAASLQKEKRQPVA